MVWELGVPEVGEGGEVSYEMKIKAELVSATGAGGDSNVIANQAAIKADGLDPVLEEEPPSIVLRVPAITIKGHEVEDLYGGSVNPGDRLRIRIGVENSGSVAASTVVVEAVFDKAVATLGSVSDNGTSQEGTVA